MIYMIEIVMFFLPLQLAMEVNYAVAQDYKKDEFLRPDHKNAVYSNYSASHKKSRLFTFNNEEGEIKIELDFSVPFLKIPIGSKSDEQFHPSLDINTRGLLTVGALAFFLVAVVPKVIKMFIPSAHSSPVDGLVPLMARVDEALRSADLKTEQCYQKVICWVGNSPMSNSVEGLIRSSSWLASALPQEAVHAALMKRKNEDCSAYKCSLSMQGIAKIVKTLTNKKKKPNS